MMTTTRIVTAALYAVSLLASRVAAEDSGASTLPIAVRGYDVVAYFTEGRPVRGSRTFSQDWDGRRYEFSSEEHRTMFAREPDRYAPQFAGLCAVAVGAGKKLEADPTIWKIIDGRLYMFSSATALHTAERDPGVLSRSQHAWQNTR